MVERRTEDDTARRVQTEGVTGRTRSDPRFPISGASTCTCARLVLEARGSHALQEAKIIREPVFASHSSEVKGLTFHATAAVLCWTHERSTTQILAVHKSLWPISPHPSAVLLVLINKPLGLLRLDQRSLNQHRQAHSLAPCSLTHSHSPRVYLAPSLAI
ncbi:hypothetical protein FOVSG1_004669 [Fusarium oxysporum f. sp. vasinfectum]